MRPLNFATYIIMQTRYIIMLISILTKSLHKIVKIKQMWGGLLVEVSILILVFKIFHHIKRHHIFKVQFFTLFTTVQIWCSVFMQSSFFICAQHYFKIKINIPWRNGINALRSKNQTFFTRCVEQECKKMVRLKK